MLCLREAVLLLTAVSMVTSGLAGRSSWSYLGTHQEADYFPETSWREDALSLKETVASSCPGGLELAWLSLALQAPRSLFVALLREVISSFPAVTGRVQENRGKKPQGIIPPFKGQHEYS